MSKLSLIRASLRKHVRYETGHSQIFISADVPSDRPAIQNLKSALKEANSSKWLWKNPIYRLCGSDRFMNSVRWERSSRIALTWTRHFSNLFSTCPGSSTCTIPSWYCHRKKTFRLSCAAAIHTPSSALITLKARRWRHMFSRSQGMERNTIP